MPASINVNLVSPSGLGDYAGCPMKLVLDTDFTPPREANPWADFGTLAHYTAMYKMGLNPPEVKDAELVESSAATLYSGNQDKLVEALEAATDKAISIVPRLPPGVSWVCEVRKHDPKLLPERVSRSGERGYGGVIDLLASDRSVLADFKFVGKPPDKVKLAYLWQMASYHLISGVPKCVLLFVTRDARMATTCTFDFSQPLMAKFAERVAAYINYIGHADFRRNAFFNEGDQCGFCTQKARCPLQAKPRLEEKTIFTAPSQPDPFMDAMLGQATPKPVAKPPAAPPPKYDALF